MPRIDRSQEYALGSKVEQAGRRVLEKDFIPKLAQKFLHFADDLSITVLSITVLLTGYAGTMEVACATAESRTKVENLAAVDF